MRGGFQGQGTWKGRLLTHASAAAAAAATQGNFYTTTSDDCELATCEYGDMAFANPFAPATTATSVKKQTVQAFLADGGGGGMLQSQPAVPQNYGPNAVCVTVVLSIDNIMAGAPLWEVRPPAPPVSGRSHTRGCLTQAG